MTAIRQFRMTILGVVAAITVPMLINKQMEAANRTKLKKAMAAYEKALNQMIIDNDIKSGPISAIEGFRATDNCSTSTTYFKKINGDGCRFQTADKVYWDISDIEHPVISLKDQITTQAESDAIKAKANSLENDKTSFVMVGEIKDGIVRINDKGVITETLDKEYLDKLYAFINKDGSSSGTSGSSTGGETTTPKTLTECTSSPCEVKGVSFVKRTNVTGQCANIPYEAFADGTWVNSCASDGDYWVSENPITFDIYGADANISSL